MTDHPYIQFLLDSSSKGVVLLGEYQPSLVVLSLIVAIITSSVSLEIANKVRTNPYPQIRPILIMIGAFTMGGGVWAMHFIGMLAFQVICGKTSYDIELTMISMIPSVLASILAMHLLSHPSPTLNRIITGGTLIGAGIGSMHYTGMAAMNISAALYYDPAIFALSIVAAIVLACLGVWIRFGLGEYFPHVSNGAQVITGGLVLGSATSAMHYIGMEAAVFIGDSQDCNSYGITYPAFLAASIAIVALLIAMMTLGLSLFLRYRAYNLSLSREQARKVAIYNTAVDGIIQINHKGEIVEFNPACEKMFGYSKEEVIGKNVKILMPAPYSAKHDGYLQHYHTTGEQKIIGIGREVSGLRKDGSQFPLELSVGEAFDPDGSMFIGILRDITERKQMEQQLLNAISEAKQAAQTKTEFLTNMSHEIRTPMNAIIGFLDMVLDKELEQEQRRQLEIVHRSAHSLLRLLNDILDAAKLEQNAFELENRPFDLPVLLDEMLSLYNHTARNKGLIWKVEWDNAIPPCYLGDVTRLRQILTNLIGNAMKFTTEGQVCLTALYREHSLVFEVSDSGIGIPQDKLDTIFTPFAQTDASISRRFGGTGLGTSIALQLAQLMGGRIEVESEVDAGSLFRVTLPLETTDCPISDTYPHYNAIKSSLPALNILVAEDVTANADLLTLRLQDAGHHTEWVQNGALAVEAVQCRGYDLILMDVQMPEMDGLTATRKIRQWEAEQNRSAIPIIALTAGAFQDDRDAANDAGMNGFVTKPIQFDKLFDEIARLFIQNDLAHNNAVHHNDKTTSANNGATHSYIELSSIDHTAGLARWGNADIFNKNLLHFAEQYQDLALQIEKLIEQGDRQAALEQSHLLKGIAGNLSLVALADAAGELESRLHKQSTTRKALQGVTLALSAAIADIDTLQHRLAVETDPAEHNPPRLSLDCQEIVHIIRELQFSLEQGEYNEESMQRLIHAIDSPELNTELNNITRAIDNFDFDPAIELLFTLAEAICPQEVKHLRKKQQ